MNYINKTSFSTCNLSLQSTLYIEKAYFGSKWSFFSGSSRTGLSEMQARSGERVKKNQIKQTKSVRCLGVILDEKLTFRDHIDHICGIALSNLNKISAIFKGASIEMCLHLYTCYVRPHLERTYPIWCGVKDNLTKIERVHRQALTRACGTFTSTPTNVIEILTHTVPIRLRLEEVLLQEATRIYRRGPTDFLCNLISELMQDNTFLNHKINSPIHMLKYAQRQLRCDISEAELTVQLSVKRMLNLQPLLHITDLKLGSSRDRTTEQAQKAKDLALDTLNKLPINEPVVFTDGSANPNPGPCGAAAVCYAEGISSMPLISSTFVSRLSTSYHGELAAIQLAINFCRSRTIHIKTKAVHIFTDCQAAMRSLATSNILQSHQGLIDSIRSDISDLQKRGTAVNIYWIAGHVDLEPNEMADKSAKEAVFLDDVRALDHYLSLTTIKRKIRQLVNQKWQREWNRGESGRQVHNLFPKIPTTRYISKFSRNKESRIIRVISGHSRLKDHMHKIKLAENPCCSCSEARQTVRHIIMDCPTLSVQRQIMIDNIDEAYSEHQIPSVERVINFNTLLTSFQCDSKIKLSILKAVIKFLDSVTYEI